MKYLIFILPFLLLGCDDHAPIPLYRAQQNIYTLRYGQTVMIRSLGIKIGFNDLLSDSRCPMGAMCYWEGVAEIKLSLTKQYMDTLFIKSSIAGYVDRNKGFHMPIDTIGIQVKLLQLDPYPKIGYKSRISSYTALLEISRL
jgi:hypothetical protein